MSMIIVEQLSRRVRDADGWLSILEDVSFTIPSGTSLAVELRGAGHFHVNEQYPVVLELDVRDGSTEKPSLRRADAAEYTQAVARFTVPVVRAGARTVVLGRMRFAVCSAENCVPESRNFAVAIN